MSDNHRGSEHRRDERIASVVSISVAFTLMAMVGAMAYGCKTTSESFMATYRACVENGGTYMPSNGASSCIAKTRP